MTGAAVCLQCAPGKYSSGGQAGWFSSGSAECTDCATGTYAASAGKGECDDCAPGQFVNHEGSLICQPCAAGQSTGGSAGADLCTECTVGHSTNGHTGASDCLVCPVGQHSDGGAPVCTFLPCDFHDACPTAHDGTCDADVDADGWDLGFMSIHSCDPGTYVLYVGHLIPVAAQPLESLCYGARALQRLA